MLRFLRLFRLALWRGFEHDVFTSARSAAYYSILTLFPALMVLASVLTASHRSVEFVQEIGEALNAIMPPGAKQAVRSYFENPEARPLSTLVSATAIMLFAASGVVVSWMDGFVRAYRMEHCWNPFKERWIAFLLVLASFVPMTMATLSAAFGSEIEKWGILHSSGQLTPLILMLSSLLRWLISMLTSVAVLALIYHFGLPRWQPWYRVLPGAALATVLWLTATEIFGWYVINYADYNQIYGPLGVAIALLVWLYIISFIVLIGAEFNALIYPRTIVAPPVEDAKAAEPAVQSR
ncbi:MAG TPA: YihY/virulence factor BrkB family protein [Terriglobales bacterium]|jgi:membrane protein|nr:YihY/virulence factor BrkB family protein [Terriglobales bacterium]